MGERRAQEGFGEWSRVSQAKLTLRTPALIPDLGSRFISCLKRTKQQLQGAWSRFSWDDQSIHCSNEHLIIAIECQCLIQLWPILEFRAPAAPDVVYYIM
eukprot:scaffold135767_cov35-Attheya_sp.AAC.1